MSGSTAIPQDTESSHHRMEHPRRGEGVRSFSRALALISLLVGLVILIMNGHSKEAMEIGTGVCLFVAFVGMPI